MTKPGKGSDLLRVNGAGENLAWSAADFENFLQPRPDLKPTMESEVEAIVRKLAEAKWPWRIHATYDETIERFLNIFERVHREHPIDKLHRFDTRLTRRCSEWACDLTTSQQPGT